MALLLVSIALAAARDSGDPRGKSVGLGVEAVAPMLVPSRLDFSELGTLSSIFTVGWCCAHSARKPLWQLPCLGVAVQLFPAHSLEQIT